MCVYFSIVQNQIFPSKGAQKLQPLNLGGWIKLMKPWNTGSIAQKGYSWYVTSCGLLINKTSPFLPAILLHRVPGAAPGAVSLALWSGQLAWHSVSLQLRHVMPRLKIGYTHHMYGHFQLGSGEVMENNRFTGSWHTLFHTNPHDNSGLFESYGRLSLTCLHVSFALGSP